MGKRQFLGDLFRRRCLVLGDFDWDVDNMAKKTSPVGVHSPSSDGDSGRRSFGRRMVVVSDLRIGLPRFWASQFWVRAQAYGPGPWFSLGQAWFCFSGLDLLDGPVTT